MLSRVLHRVTSSVCTTVTRGISYDTQREIDQKEADLKRYNESKEFSPPSELLIRTLKMSLEDRGIFSPVNPTSFSEIRMDRVCDVTYGGANGLYCAYLGLPTTILNLLKNYYLNPSSEESGLLNNSPLRLRPYLHFDHYHDPENLRYPQGLEIVHSTETLAYFEREAAVEINIMRMIDALKIGGRFCGQFFGPNHTAETRSFLRTTEKTIKRLFAHSVEIECLQRTQGFPRNSNGKQVRSDLFSVIVKKTAPLSNEHKAEVKTMGEGLIK